MVTALVDLVEIDAATAEDFWMCLAPLLPEQPGEQLTIDLREVRFMASVGVGVLLKADRHARRTGGSIELVNTQRPVRRVLEVSGVADLFDAP